MRCAKQAFDSNALNSRLDPQAINICFVSMAANLIIGDKRHEYLNGQLSKALCV